MQTKNSRKIIDFRLFLSYYYFTVFAIDSISSFEISGESDSNR